MDRSSKEDPQSPTSVITFPRSIGRAAILLKIIGVVLLLFAVYGMLLVYQFIQRTNQGSALCDSWIFLFPGFLGARVLQIGIRFARGIPTDTLVTGIVTCILGLPIGFFSAVLLLNALMNFVIKSSKEQSWVQNQLIIGITGLVAGFLMLAAGTLLLIGRNSYREWKKNKNH